MANKVPSYTFTGESTSEMKGGTWYIYLKSSGSFKLNYSKKAVDIFLCGGGGGGCTVTGENGGGGGAGGYLATRYGQALGSDQHYIQVGAGGSPSSKGGTTTAFGLSADGGGTGDGLSGSLAGTGAGGDGGHWNPGNNTGNGGTAGSNGQLAFGEGSIKYGGGGGGGGCKYSYPNGAGGQTGGGAGGSGNGTANTGGGGGGAKAKDGGGQVLGGCGGSGVVILRGTEDDFTPVWFDGVHVSEIFFNGEKVNGLIYDGMRLFAQMIKRLGWDRHAAQRLAGA